jgi:hypothetical protein
MTQLDGKKAVKKQDKHANKPSSKDTAWRGGQAAGWDLKGSKLVTLQHSDGDQEDDEERDPYKHSPDQRLRCACRPLRIHRGEMCVVPT